MLDSWYRQAPSRKSTSARSMSETRAPRRATEPRSSAPGLLQLALLHSRPPFAGERTELELLRARGLGCEPNLGKLRGRFRVFVLLAQRPRARGRLPAARSVTETPVRRSVASTPSRSASHRPFRRSDGSSPFDLAEVLLREPAGGELGLRKAGGPAQRAHALAQAVGGFGRANRLREGHGPLFSPLAAFPVCHQ